MPSLDESRQAGFSRGHTAANWQEAQTSLPTPDVAEQAQRLANEQVTYDPDEWASGYLMGWDTRMEGKYEDGTPMPEGES